eukprot:844399_1
MAFLQFECLQLAVAEHNPQDAHNDVPSDHDPSYYPQQYAAHHHNIACDKVDIDIALIRSFAVDNMVNTAVPSCLYLNGGKTHILHAEEVNMSVGYAVVVDNLHNADTDDFPRRILIDILFIIEAKTLNDT